MQSATAMIGIDAGNSAVKVALLRKGEVDRTVAVSTRPVDRLCGELVSYAGDFSGIPEAELAVVSSVCPEANAAIEKFARTLDSVRSFFFLARRHVPLRISTAVTHPDTVGIDRLLCGYAAAELYGFPCVVIGAGTAVTVDLIGDSGEFEGGAIAPGFRLAARSLSEWTSCLPEVAPKAPESICGRNTEEAIQSGVYHFCRGGATMLGKGLRRSCKGDAVTVMTGGDLEYLGALDVGGRCYSDPHLLFKAIWHIGQTGPEPGE